MESEKSAKVIAVYNKDYGIGVNATLNLADRLCCKGFSVLVVDFDYIQMDPTKKLLQRKDKRVDEYWLDMDLPRNRQKELVKS